MASHTNMYKNLHFDTRKEAEDVLDSMIEIAKTLGRVTKADLMRAINQPVVFADTKFFWTEPMLRHTEVSPRLPSGYVLQLTDPIHECDAKAKAKTSESRPDMTLRWYEVLFQTREEAEDVLAKMREIAEDYTYANVVDLKDLAGVNGDYSDSCFGWTERTLGRDIEVYWSDWGGYLIDFPAPIQLIAGPVSKKISYKDCNSLEKPGPKPVFITINRDVHEDMDDVLKSLFKQMACLPGREFHITIE